MSAEALLITAIVDEGVSAVRKMYASGITANDFFVYQSEAEWIERRLAKRKPITRRAFMEVFGADFEFVRARGETVEDLARNLKEEIALAKWNSIMATAATEMTKDNVLEMLASIKAEVSQVTRMYAPMSDVDLDDYEVVIEKMKQGMLLAAQGQSLGIMTGVPHIDHHMGGLMPGQFVMVSGRTGSAKSYLVTYIGWPARKEGLNVGVFSPELNDHEVRCRYHTIASADKSVQAACGLQRSFRNRALMDRNGFNLKTYQHFCEYMRSLPGSMHMLCGAGMKEQMSVGYIEDRIAEYGLDLVIVDPIYLLKPVRLHGEGNNYQEVAWIAEALHRVGEQFNIPILFTNQAHLDGPKGDAPSIDKSFGAKAMLHLADYVIAVQHMSEEHLLIVKANKSRFGEAWRFSADFLPNTGHFHVTTPLPKTSYYNGYDPDEAENATRSTVVKGRAQ